MAHHSQFLLFALLALPCAAHLESCSSIINGSKQDVTVMSEPADATLKIDGDSGIGHLTLPITRGKPHLIEVKKDGYQTVRITTGSGTAGAFYGNIPLPLEVSIIGELIDLTNGTAYSVDPDRTTVILEKGSGVIDQTTDNSAAFGIIAGIVLTLAIWVPIGYLLAAFARGVSQF